MRDEKVVREGKRISGKGDNRNEKGKGSLRILRILRKKGKKRK